MDKEKEGKVTALEKKIEKLEKENCLLKKKTYLLNDCLSIKESLLTEVVRNSLIEKENFELSDEVIPDWKQIFDAVPDFIAILDTHHRIRRINKAMARRLGIETDNIIGEYCYEKVHGLLQPPPYCPHSKLLKNVKEHIGEIYDELLGGYFLVSVSPLYDKNGHLWGSIHVARDITECKQAEAALRVSEEKYRLFIETANDAIFIIDAETGFILESNKRAEELIGRTAHEIIGLHYLQLHPEDETEYYKKLFYEHLHCGMRHLITKDVFVYHKDGHKLPVEISSSVTHVGGRKILYSIFRDITERKKLEEKLYQSQKLESIGTLAGGIAHDFNNILMAIMGYTELLLYDIGDNNLHNKNLQEILKAGARAKELVKQILTFSRQGKEEKKPLRLSLIIKEVLMLLRASIPSTIEIHQNIKTESDTVMANATQIYQVLMNLCVNAFHAMQDKGGILTVSLTDSHIDESNLFMYPYLEPKHYLKLSVSDTGHGMNKETINRIFDPFYTTKEQGQGTGMGLSVVHGIVKSHGGMINVDSESGKGTIFNIFFPSHSNSFQDVAEKEMPIVGGDESILFVDDEDTIVQMNKQILERLGYRVTGSTDSRKALEIFCFQPHNFDLVITDLTMPNVTGIELAKEVFKIRASIPVILCTGVSEVITHEQAKAMGISEYISKPIITRDLNSAIRRALNF